MKKTPSDPADIAALRRRAEEKLQGKQKGLQKEMDARGEQLEAQRLVHELQVHQIELEMQNDELRRALLEIEESQARYLNLYDFSPTGYFTFDREGRIEAANLTGAQLLGLERGRLIGRRFGLFVSTADRLAFNAFLEKVFASRTKETCEAELSKEKKMPPSTERSGNRRFGETGQIIVHIEAIASENGQECRAVINDITERKRAEEALRESEERYRELSIIDDLTQLYNSRHFYQQLKMEIDRVARYGQPLTLLLLDLDDFKQFNDTYGHIEGDQVLMRFGQVVKRCLRQTDSAYRYGGEEFTILLPMTTSEDGAVTAERIRSELKKEIFSPVSGKDVYISVSIGLAQYKPQEDMKAFVHRVDQLMYQSKKNGKDRVCPES
jgi:diguanylate cyclase (GGDEF)-like protein/PAS domain S-box-containing protein